MNKSAYLEGFAAFKAGARFAPTGFAPDSDDDREIYSLSYIAGWEAARDDA